MNDFMQMNEKDKIVLEYKKICDKLAEVIEQKYVAEHMVNVYETDLDQYQKSLSNFKMSEKIFKRKKYLAEKFQLEFEINNANKSLQEYQLTINKLNNQLELLENRKDELSDIAEKSMKNELEETNRVIKAQISYDSDGIPIIDDKQPENISACIDCNFDESTFSFSELALVHATNYFPYDKTIKTAQEAKVISTGTIDVNGDGQKVSSYSHRNSIHFALNGKVSSHSYGNWDSCQYIIIEPMKYHLEDINSISPEDTWTNGSVKLSSEAIILVSEKEYENIAKSSSLIDKYKIVKFRGNSDICVHKILLLLGYKPQKIGMHSWSKQDSNYENKNTLILYNYVQQNCPEKWSIKHYYSDEKEVSENLLRRDMILANLRNESVDTKTGMQIDLNEVVVLFRWYLKTVNFADDYIFDYKQLAEFIKAYGIRYNNGCFYLLDDKTVLKSYNEKTPSATVEEIYSILKTFQPEIEDQQKTNLSK